MSEGIKYAKTDKQKSAETFAIQSGISDPHSNHTRSEKWAGQQAGVQAIRIFQHTPSQKYLGVEP